MTKLDHLNKLKELERIEARKFINVEESSQNADVHGIYTYQVEQMNYIHQCALVDNAQWEYDHS